MSYYSCGINPPGYTPSTFIPPVTEEELFSSTAPVASAPPAVFLPQTTPPAEVSILPRQLSLHIDLKSGILRVTIE